MKYGYARVSSRDQDFSIQEAALKAAGCELIRAEKVSGAGREGRTELDLLLQFLRPGDELVVTRIDPGTLHWRLAGHCTDAASEG